MDNNKKKKASYFIRQPYTIHSYHKHEILKKNQVQTSYQK